MSADAQDSLRTDRFYDRPARDVETDLDDEEVALADDLWADEYAAEELSERLADTARDEMVGDFYGDAT